MLVPIASGTLSGTSAQTQVAVAMHTSSGSSFMPEQLSMRATMT
jgi:hypothetical protein